jgi:hypothetical protein
MAGMKVQIASVLLLMLASCSSPVSPLERDNPRDPGSERYLPTPAQPLTVLIEDGEVHLRWTPRSDFAEGYIVERALDDLSFEEIGTTASDRHTFADVPPPATEVHYRVSAFAVISGIRQFEEGPVVTATFVPSSFSPSWHLVSERRVRLTWSRLGDDLAEHTHFEVWKSVNGGEKELFGVTVVGESSLEDDIDLMRNDRAEFTLVARIGSQRRVLGTSDVLHFKIRRPADLRVRGSMYPVLSWRDPGNMAPAAGFVVERCMVVEQRCEPFADVGSVEGDVYSFTDLEAEPAIRYRYRVRTLTSGFSQDIEVARSYRWVLQERDDRWGAMNVILLPDGEHYLATVNGRIEHANIRTGEVLESVLVNAQGIDRIALASEEGAVLVGSNRRVHRRYLSDLRRNEGYSTFLGDFQSLAASRDGTTYAVSVYDASGVTLRRASDHVILASIDRPTGNLTFTHDSRYLAYAGDGVTLFDAKTGAVHRNVAFGNSVAIAAHPKRNVIAYAIHPEIEIRDLDRNVVERRLPYIHSFVRQGMLSFSANGRYLVATSASGAVWDLETGAFLGSLDLTDAHLGAAITDDAEWLVTVNGFQIVRYRRSSEPAWYAVPWTQEPGLFVDDHR